MPYFFVIMKRIIKEIYPYIIVIIVALLIKNFIVTPIRVNGSSMDNTLNDKDIMLLDKLSYRFNDIKRFDIVVIKYEDEFIIKRVIGLPDEKVRLVNNVLYINDIPVKEKFLEEETDDFTVNKRLPANHYFVMGDNRSASKDSRIIGFIKKEDILGKTSITIFPFKRFGIKK
ncbi:MAG: signal peptidase I [Bacilli bacterium]